ncbi:MAG: alpha/beta fold hydrolase [Pseudomonadales bacterium]
MSISNKPLPLTRVVVFFVLFCLSPSFAADTVENADPEYFELGDFDLGSGETIRDCQLAYRTIGTLNHDSSNVVLFPTWFTGHSADIVESGEVGPERMVDSNNFFVVVVDALGNGVSCSPSNSKSQAGAAFPAITIQDMVHSQYLLLTKQFGFSKIKAVVGTSMGGMQAFQWAVDYPHYMEMAIPIESTPIQTSFDLLNWTTQQRLIDSMLESDHSNSEIMSLITAVEMLTMFTPDFVVRSYAPEAYQEFLGQWEVHFLSRDVMDFRVQLEAMINHDIYRGHDSSIQDTVSHVKAKILVIVEREDHQVNPQPAIEFAGLAKAELHVIAGDCGHLGSAFCYQAKVKTLVSEFLAQ